MDTEYDWSNVGNDKPTTTTTTQSNGGGWSWKGIVDTVSNLGKAGTEAYRNYSAGNLNEQLALSNAQAANRPVNWPMIAAIGGGLLLVVVLLLSLGGRRS